MGKKTETKNDPWAPAQPYILQNLADTKATYDANQPKLQGFSTLQQDTYGRLAPGAEAGITGAQSLVNRNLSGANLTGNPYLEGIIGKTRRNVTDATNAEFTSAGRFGSGAHTGMLARELADAENSLRYQDYGVERGYQQGAIGDAQNLMGGATGLINNAAQLPWVGVQAQNGGTNSLTNGYGVTTTQSSGLGAVMESVGGLASGLGGLASGVKGLGGIKLSDERMKNVGPQVGTSPEGLPLYGYTYKGDPTQTPQVGPMAQDVEKVRPDAVMQGPGGAKMVDFSKVDAPAPTVTPGGAPLAPDYAGLRQNVPAITPKPSFWQALTNPDPNTEQGQAMMLSARLLSNSPLRGLGDALSGMYGERDARAADSRDFELRHEESIARRQAMRDRALQANEPPAPRIMQRRDGSVISVDPVSGLSTVVSGPVGGTEPLVATESGYQPRSKAVGMMPYRAPRAAAGGGGGRAGGAVPPASAARYRAEAAAAIARGADPAKVNARLAQIMGGK